MRYTMCEDIIDYYDMFRTEPKPTNLISAISKLMEQFESFQESYSDATTTAPPATTHGSPAITTDPPAITTDPPTITTDYGPTILESVISKTIEQLESPPKICLSASNNLQTAITELNISFSKLLEQIERLQKIYSSATN